jgi:hypothetical protein
MKRMLECVTTSEHSVAHQAWCYILFVTNLLYKSICLGLLDADCGSNNRSLILHWIRGILAEIQKFARNSYDIIHKKLKKSNSWWSHKFEKSYITMSNYFANPRQPCKFARNGKCFKWPKCNFFHPMCENGSKCTLITCQLAHRYAKLDISWYIWILKYHNETTLYELFLLSLSRSVDLTFSISVYLAIIYAPENIYSLWVTIYSQTYLSLFGPFWLTPVSHGS